MSYKYEREIAAQVAQDAIRAGFRAFLAESGRYGFYTDTGGTRVISFQVDFLSPTLSGNYVTNKGRETGTGWRISDGYVIGDIETLKRAFQSIPPRWAVKDSKWRFATLKDHQDRYQSSSRYVEVREDDNA